MSFTIETRPTGFLRPFVFPTEPSDQTFLYPNARSVRFHVAQAGEVNLANTADRRRNSRERVRNHRARMRANGMRLLQIWVPDTRTAEFAEEAHRQSLAVANSPHAQEDQAFIDAIACRDLP